MSSGLRQFVGKIVLQKDFMMFKVDANEDFMFSRLINYQSDGFNTGFVKLFEIFSSACI